MKKNSVIFLQSLTVLIGVITILLLVRFPLTEGRAENLDLLSIYLDPFILYGYASSIAFFIALYKAFMLLGNIRRNRLFTLGSLKILKQIKYCAIILSILIALTGVYIKLFHDKNDDPAGFLGMVLITTFISISVVVAITVLEKILQNAVDLKYENELTI